MIELIFYIGVLLTSGALIGFLLRQKGSYFRSVQILFAIGLLSYASLAFFDLIKNFLVRAEWVVLSTTIGSVSATLITAIAVEHAALALFKRRREKVSSKTFFREKLNILSVIYKGYATSVLIITWVFAPWQTRLVMDFWGGRVYTPVYELWYLVSLSMVLVAFTAYPCTLFYLASRKYREKSVVSALRWLGLCWAGIGVTVIMYHGYLRSLGIEAVSIGYLFQLFFFSIIAYFFKKTTILESFFEKPYPSIPVRKGEVGILTYTSKADKMKTFSAFISDGIVNGDRIAYIYPDEESGFARSKLATHGIDVDKYERDGTLFMKSLSEFFMQYGSFDKEEPIRLLLNRRAEAKRMGRKVREIEDVGDFSFLKGQWQRYLDYWNDPRWGVPPGVGLLYEPFMMELTAINVEGMSEAQVSDVLKAFGGDRVAPTKLIDLIAHVDVFSKALGLTRQELTGRTILFEIDPASAYEKPVGDFAAEALANVEPVALFTHKGSVIYSALGNTEPIKVLLLTQRISTPQMDASTNEMLLPANNTPLLLDALEKMLKTSPHSNLNIVFDSLSSLILLVGFEKTYSFVRYALDMLASENSTALFLFSPDVHDQKVISSLRSLFSNHVSYREGSLQIVKVPEFKLKAQIEG